MVGDRDSANAVGAVDRQFLYVYRPRHRARRHAADRRRGGGDAESVGSGGATVAVDNLHRPGSAIVGVVKRRIPKLAGQDVGSCVAGIRVPLRIVLIISLFEHQGFCRPCDSAISANSPNAL